jgi:hypothetical protein
VIAFQVDRSTADQHQPVRREAGIVGHRLDNRILDAPDRIPAVVVRGPIKPGSITVARMDEKREG